MSKNQQTFIKDPYTKTHFATEQELNDFIACCDPKTGYAYFMSHFFYIQHPTKGSMLYQPWDYQVELAQNYHDYRFSVNLLSRQLGKTTTAAGYLLWYAMFIPDSTILMCSYQHSYNASFSGLGGVVYMGTEGTITLKGSEVHLNGKKVEGVGTNVNNFAAEIKEFVTAIRESRQPMASGREIRPVIAVMEAIIRSAETHEVVGVEV